MKKDILIIGAGAAGLMAASKLCRQFNVKILEARERTGGRVCTVDLNGIAVEAGAEFIHGSLKQTMRLLKKAGIGYTSVTGKMYRKEEGIFTEQTKPFEGWKGLLKKMKAEKKDIPLTVFLDQYYSGNRYAKLRKHVKQYTEGFDIADPKKAGIKTLYHEWSAEQEEIYRVKGGYSSLLDYLQKRCKEKGCTIVMGKTVNAINWSEEGVLIEAGTERFKASAALITVPVNLLQNKKGSIHFFPPIDRYHYAAKEIGFGQVIKFIFFFSKRFWQEDAAFFFSDTEIPAWWTGGDEHPTILTGWIGGPNASALSKEEDEFLIEKAVYSLSQIFEKTVEDIKANIIAAKVFNWQKEQFSKGAYSFETPASVTAKELLSVPVDNTIWFAGEALYSGSSPGTVEAALVSGKDVSKKIRKHLMRK